MLHIALISNTVFDIEEVTSERSANVYNLILNVEGCYDSRDIGRCSAPHHQGAFCGISLAVAQKSGRERINTEVTCLHNQYLRLLLWEQWCRCLRSWRHDPACRSWLQRRGLRSRGVKLLYSTCASLFILVSHLSNSFRVTQILTIDNILKPAFESKSCRKPIINSWTNNNFISLARRARSLEAVVWGSFTSAMVIVIYLERNTCY